MSLHAEAGSLKLGMTTWVGYGPLFLARDMGYFKEGGLDVSLEIIEEASMYMAAVAAGELDGSASTIDEIMKYRSKDVCFKSVYALDDSHGGDGVLAPTEVKSVADLKGMEVGLNEGSVSQFWFNILLKQAGLTQADVKVTNMTADDAAAAFMADPRINGIFLPMRAVAGVENLNDRLLRKRSVPDRAVAPMLGDLLLHGLTPFGIVAGQG